MKSYLHFYLTRSGAQCVDFFLYLYVDVRFNAVVTMDVLLLKDGTLTDGT